VLETSKGLEVISQALFCVPESPEFREALGETNHPPSTLSASSSPNPFRAMLDAFIFILQSHHKPS
jgi:hypothetical protein